MHAQPLLWGVIWDAFCKDLSICWTIRRLTITAPECFGTWVLWHKLKLCPISKPKAYPQCLCGVISNKFCLLACVHETESHVAQVRLRLTT